VQGFAVFVAISVLLGRIYLLSYFEGLGIPHSEIRLSVTDYSVASPVVTVFGVGFSLILAILVWSDGLGEIEVLSRLARILLGSALWIAAILTPFLLLPILQPDINSVWLAILMLFAFALGSFGGAAIGSGIFGDGRPSHQHPALRKAFMPVLVTMVAILGIVIAAEFAELMGKLESDATWANAPQARIALNTNSDTVLHIGPDGCGPDSLRCHFRVIEIGDKFVYLRPISDPDQERLFAVPIGDIASINYLYEDRTR